MEKDIKDNHDKTEQEVKDNNSAGDSLSENYQYVASDELNEAESQSGDDEDQSGDEEEKIKSDDDILVEEQDDEIAEYVNNSMKYLNKSLQPQSHQDKTQKIREEVEKTLVNCLTDLLVNLYNSKEQQLYENLYIKIIQKLHWQSKNVYAPNPLDSKVL